MFTHHVDFADGAHAVHVEVTQDERWTTWRGENNNRKWLHCRR